MWLKFNDPEEDDLDDNRVPCDDYLWNDFEDK